MIDILHELTWRGMLHDMTPGLENHVKTGMCSAYLGFDPTADSLHIGHLVGVMTLLHFQRAGHKPYALVGGATGMIGDPSFKSAERNLLDKETLAHNVECIKKQLSQFLDFSDSISNKAELVNNYDWMSQFSFLDFIRDVGKHITVNYMMAKDSVKKRLEEGSGLSFTEFSYQLIQGYDFYHLWKHNNVTIQLGGSDQWGNIVTGTELIRRMEGGTAYALTVPLITKADGTKFGKTESGSVWLDPHKTSPYAFYQFWLNVSDEDAEKYIKIFTTFTKEETEALIEQHRAAPHTRTLQKALGKSVTTMVHGEKEYQTALKASEILFGKSSTEDLASLDERTFLQVFEGVPMAELSKSTLDTPSEAAVFLADVSGAFPSRGEARRMLQQGAVHINKEKWSENQPITSSQILNGRYMVIQKGKKNYFLVKFV
ncbi:tyrosine--tRNA ligase [Thermaurantimonas aggregans]|uniref:Tyrosine--tRNA ligase n=1 Tax=Thermaurantimonas aggregans TaxID=2173829 RepID=A0A401XN73_9FLAO|nr:tyrosine--tRNA ligase [Thermaurantimonas aggregans]MCX8148482.1 tyrosine--tRNA ligase [Thermaurantimonas aggregans]GCD78466.1 tyrosine--tRNA ligase [Thermaurantimonas aggregans]